MLSIASVQDGDRQYVVLERAEEVRRLDLADLGYFDGALGMSDYPAMFRSWLTSAEPVLLGCLAGNRLLGWCMFEEWDRSDADKTPIHVLRMIEVGAGYRQRNIGRFLTALAAMIAPGHMVTRPLTIASERFFQRLGFIRPPEGAQVDFHDKFGYLLLPTSAKQGLIQTSSRERLILQQEAITHSSNKLKTAILRGELLHEPSFARAFMSKVAKPTAVPNGVARSFIKAETSALPCACGSIDIAFYSLLADEREEVRVECERCGDVWLTVPV